MNNPAIGACECAYRGEATGEFLRWIFKIVRQALVASRGLRADQGEEAISKETESDSRDGGQGEGQEVRLAHISYREVR